MRLFCLLLFQLLFCSTLEGQRPRNLTVKEVTNDSALVLWDVQDSCSIAYFEIRGYLHFTGYINISSSRTYYSLTGLDPNTNYYIRITSVSTNETIYPSLSASIHFTTASVPSQPVVSSNTHTTQSISVSMSGCSNSLESVNGPVTRVFEYRRSSGKGAWRRIETTEMSLTIMSLQEDTRYDFRAYCYNSIGRSSYSEKRWNRTLSEDDVRPAMLSCQNVNTNSIELYWNRPSFYSTAMNYTVRAHYQDVAVTMIVSTISTSVHFPNLTPNTTYIFQIRAVVSEEEVTSWSTPLSITTLPNVPSKLANVNINEISSTSFKVSWTPLAGFQGSYFLTVQHHNTVLNEVYLSQMQTEFSIVGLEANTKYQVAISAINSVGLEGVGVTVNVKTISIGNVSQLYVRYSTTTTISIAWTTDLETTRCDLVLLDLDNSYTRNVSLACSEQRIQSSVSRTTGYTFHGLQPDTSYQILMTPWNNGGRGNASMLLVSTSSAELSITTIGLSSTVGVLVVISILTVTVLIIKQVISTRRFKVTTDNGRQEADEIEMQSNPVYVPIHSSSHTVQVCQKEEDRVVERELEFVSEEVKAAEKELQEKPKLPQRVYLEEHNLALFSSTPVYHSQDSFEEKSGWFNPNLTTVLLGKLTENSQDSVTVDNLTVGVVMLTHRKKKSARFIGSSSNLFSYLYKIFKDLYKKEMNELTPIEVELKYFSPNAEDWSITVWLYDDADQVSMATNQKIIEHCCLRPHGLNHEIIYSEKGWKEFCNWYMRKRDNN